MLASIPSSMITVLRQAEVLLVSGFELTDTGQKKGKYLVWKIEGQVVNLFIDCILLFCSTCSLFYARNV